MAQTWTGGNLGTDMNWSDAANWSGGAPNSSSAVLFPDGAYPITTNIQGAVNNIVQSSTTISTLTYANSSNTYPAFQETLNINQYLDPSLTYAVVLIDTSGANSTLGLPGVDVSDTNNSFDNGGNPYGVAYENNPSTHPYPTISSMVQSGGGSKNGLVTSLDDETYGFSQIQLVPGNNIVPTPEPRTAAAILCALFVAALVGRQLILRRQESDTGSMAVAA